MDATVDTQRRPLGRSRVIAAAIGALVLVSAAAGYLVTTLGPQGGVAAAGRWAVELTTTLESGATVTGTGVIVSSSGEVVTSYNVVNGAVSIAATVGDGGPHYVATTFALSPADGVAVLQLLDAKGLPSAGIGDSSRLTVGDHVTAIRGTGSGRARRLQGAIVGLGQTSVTSAPRQCQLGNVAGPHRVQRAAAGRRSGWPARRHVREPHRVEHRRRSAACHAHVGHLIRDSGQPRDVDRPRRQHAYTESDDSPGPRCVSRHRGPRQRQPAGGAHHRHRAGNAGAGGGNGRRRRHRRGEQRRLSTLSSRPQAAAATRRWRLRVGADGSIRKDTHTRPHCNSRRRRSPERR